MIPVAGASARKVTSVASAPTDANRLVDAHALVGAGYDLRGKASVGIAVLDDFIGLQDADQPDLLAEAAVVAILRKHGELDVGVNAIARVMPHVAELAANDGNGPADSRLHFDNDHGHGSSLSTASAASGMLLRRGVAIFMVIGYPTPAVAAA